MSLSKIRTIKMISPGRIIPTTEERPLINTALHFNGHQTLHSTHAIHPYIAAINPPLARTLIETYVPRGETVLDPFCGGGGVLVESILSGRKCVGFDINPLAVIISKAKTTWLPKKRLLSELKRIIDFHAAYKGLIEPKVGENVYNWFLPDTMADLACFSKAVSTCKEAKIRTFFQAVLSITARSVMLTYRGEVRLRRLRDEDLNKFCPDALAVFLNKAEIAIERVSALSPEMESKVDFSDIRQLPLIDGECHSIICSPPYADDTNGVGYFQFSRYLLEWIGLTPAEISAHKQSFLGEDLDGKEPPDSETLMRSLRAVKKRSEKHYRQAVAFYADYASSLREMSRTVTDWIVIVIGNRVLSRTQFDNANITVELFENEQDIELHDYYTREIRKKRIANLGGDGGGISEEHILVFRKK